MIKIIEKGKDTFEMTCKRCGCRFSYDTEDAKGTYTDEIKVECPQCEYNNNHPRQDIPAKKIEIISDEEATNNSTSEKESGVTVSELLGEPVVTLRAYSNCCEGCNFYETVVKAGKSYIGDSPCTNCFKGKLTRINS